jgi:hypothetical protein
MSMEHLVDWEIIAETEVLRENLPQCHFVHRKSLMTWPGIEFGGRGGKPATNRPSYGTAYEDKLRQYSRPCFPDHTVWYKRDLFSK